MESFVDSRSRNSVIKRMIELGLIAERSEILPSKQRKSKNSRPSNGSDNDTSDNDSDSSDSDGSDEHDTRKIRLTIKTARNSKKSKQSKQKSASIARQKLNDIRINVAEVQLQIVDINDDLKQHFDWLKESLNDAADDVNADDDDDDDDPNDGVPIVPYSMAQKDALENPQFKKLLLALGLHEPIAEMVSVQMR